VSAGTRQVSRADARACALCWSPPDDSLAVVAMMSTENPGDQIAAGEDVRPGHRHGDSPWRRFDLFDD